MVFSRLQQILFAHPRMICKGSREVWFSVIKSTHQGVKLKDLCLCACVYIYMELLNQQHTLGFPGGTSGKESTCQCRRRGFDPRVGKIFCGRKWQPTPGLWPGESHGERSPMGHSPRCHNKSDTAELRSTVAYHTQRDLIWGYFHHPEMIACVHCRYPTFLTSVSPSQRMTEWTFAILAHFL